MQRVRLARPFVVASGIALGCSSTSPPSVADTAPKVTDGMAAKTNAASPAPIATSPDQDGDGMPDADDQCPLEPETFNGREDTDGCPDQKVVITSSNPPAPSVIHFEGATAKPLAEADAVLDEVARVMRDHPEVRLLQLEGHADPTDAKQLAIPASQMRADAVQVELVKRGVEATRLHAVGLGAYCPIDDAPNPERARRNRRVEFKIATVDTASNLKPIGELGCEPAREAGLIP